MLTASLADINDKVRRKTMATMGELLFFIASQQQVGHFPLLRPGTSASMW